MRAAGSPNADVQINQALTNLTKNAIALDRIAIARPQSFTKITKNQKGEDVEIPEVDHSKYIDFRSKFPTQMDQRAFKLDLNDNEKDSQDLVDEMAAKLNSKKANEQKEANRFFKSLRVAKRLGYY